jgi:2-C-methyl-D-erythritol 4-phosphate cytidylyltransferase
MIPSVRLWALVPAAGSGRRMGTDIPKQYLPFAGKTVLQITLEKLAALPQMAGLLVAVSQDDVRFSELELPSRVTRVVGGRERADSVFNGLRHLMAQGYDRDWVLVHDAARPCVRTENIARLMERVLQSDCGGILAVPIADTLKQSAGGKIARTVDRNGLWAAHTPQMFRVGELFRALETALGDGASVTDEASAIEYCGGEVLLVPDARDNIKITQPEDLWLAEQIFRRQQISQDSAL